jgi:hypothetical protein
MISIEVLEEGAEMFVKLYEDIMNQTKVSNGIKILLEDFYEEAYLKIKKVLGED